MASLLEKVGTLISANLHDLVDRALKQNSLAVINQYIRQVEDNLEDLEDAALTVGGQVNTLKRKFEEYQARAEELDRSINVLLQESKEELAVAQQSKYNSSIRLATDYKEQYERQQAEYEKLREAKLKLEARLTTIKQEREELQALLDLAKAKEITYKTMSGLDDLMGAGDSDVARMAESIRARLDKASAQSEMMASRLEDQIDEVLDRRTIDSQLVERKKKLGLE
jgi:phage shock protein A